MRCKLMSKKTTTGGKQTMLMRFDPFRELDRLTQTLDRSWPSMLAMDAYRRGEEFIVHFDLPGARPDSIDLSVEKNVLTVRAERRANPTEGGEVVVTERPQGNFTRQLFLGDSLDADHIRAGYENGVLTLTIPVAEKAKPRRLQVEVNGTGPEAVNTTSSQTIDASSSSTAA
jgi:HSP20 family protein